MIAIGTDVLSRGMITEGVMSGEYLMSFLLIYLSVMKYSDNLLKWINYWQGQGDKLPLTMEYWLKIGQ